MQYRVIKDMPNGWEGSAFVGDTLTLGRWEGVPTLFKDDKAICDADSPYANERCVPVKEGTHD